MSERVEFFLKGPELLADPYHYVASGLDNIYLLNGVTTQATAYGPMITIENLNGLHNAIGLYIVEKPSLMTGPNFHFVRKHSAWGRRIRCCVGYTSFMCFPSRRASRSSRS
jgi:hypothetical protein